MAIDMTEVRQLFFEESFENLDLMESNLLDIEVGTVDKELVNSIFRAAHSIKGGAGIFKFEQIINFAHVAETLLDEMRKGEHLITQPIIDILLRAVDIMRMMLKGWQENTSFDHHSVSECEKQLKSFLKASIEEKEPPPLLKELSPEPSPEPSSLPPLPTVPSPGGVEGWHIVFKPHLDILKTGNDPINLFRELANLGALEVTIEISQLPLFIELEPQCCYLSWELTLYADVNQSLIDEIFEWVEGDCELHITALPKLLPEEQLAMIQAPSVALVPEEQPYPAATSLISNSLESESSQTPQETHAPFIPNASFSPESSKVSSSEEQVLLFPLIEPHTTITQTSEVTQGPIVHPSKTPPSSSSPPMEGTIPVSDSVPSKTPMSEASSIRVGIDKIDNLINIVGELVITQSMLDQVGRTFDTHKLSQLRDGLSQLERNTRELQESVMRIRMLPISYSFNRFPRLVHDLSVQLGKKVELKLSGVHTELDKTVLEKMSDPLVHLVRNALDHGVELPKQRQLAGKPETGLLHLHAFHQGGNIIIQISDDGIGLDVEKIRKKAILLGLSNKEDNLSDEQIYEFIFLPGFSTVEQVSDLSGRGVGMDVVRRNIRALGGTIEVRSKPGRGTTFSIRLPLTLAILDGQLVRVGKEIYILSLLSIIESLRIKPLLVNSLAGKAEVYKLRDEYIPILRLYELFGITPSTTQLDQGLLVIVEGDGQKIGLFVDELLSQQQIVIKSLETNFKKMQGISGATILGDGSVALILDIAGLIQLFHGQNKHSSSHRPSSIFRSSL